MSCPVLSCPMPLPPGMRMSFSYSESVCFCCCPSFSVVPLSLCLVFFLSVFVLLFCKRSGSDVHFFPRPCFENSSTVHRHKGLHFTCSPTSRAHFTLLSTVCIIAKGLGSLQKLAQAAEHRYGQLPDSQLHTRTTSALLGNRWSQRPCVPALASPNRSFFCTLFCVVFKLSPTWSLAVFRFPADAPHVDGSAHLSNDHCPYFHFSLERKNAGHFSDHVCKPCGRRQPAL